MKLKLQVSGSQLAIVTAVSAQIRDAVTESRTEAWGPNGVDWDLFTETLINKLIPKDPR